MGAPPPSRARRQKSGENANIEFRNPVIMNLEPFHQVSGDMSRDSSSSVTPRQGFSFLKVDICDRFTDFSYDTVTQWYSDTQWRRGRGMGCSGRLNMLQWLCTIQWLHMIHCIMIQWTCITIQWTGWIGWRARHLAKSCYSSHWPPPVFGFATNKKLISLQSQENLMRSWTQLVDGEYLLWQMCSIWLWCEVDDH